MASRHGKPMNMKTWIVALLLVGTTVTLANAATAQDPYPCVPTGTLLDTTVVCTDQSCGYTVNDCALYAEYCAEKFLTTGLHVDYAFFCASKLRNGLL